jgi:serine/threonine protein kinase
VDFSQRLAENRAVTHVGPYEVLDRIGRGGMATVYVARDPELAREVALKRLDGVDDPDHAARFVREAQLSASLQHPHIVTVHGFVVEAGVPYIVMEYLPRGALRRYVGRMTRPQVLGVLRAIMDALAYTGARAIVHRDLKPENVLVTDGGGVKLTDFGIAKALRAVNQDLTGARGLFGTPMYMAPERAQEQELTPAVDVYAAGVVAWELVAGRAPFSHNLAPLAILFKHVNEPIERADAVDPLLDAALADWIERLLAKDPDERPAAADALAELEELAVAAHGALWSRAAPLPAPDALPPPPPALADEIEPWVEALPDD